MTDRIKNGFQFEWDDREIGYEGLIGDFGIEKSIPVGSRKFIVFNYSTEYFRRKVANKNSLVFLRGGNIPSDMGTETTIQSPAANQTSVPSEITCSTLTGTASEIVQATTPDNITGDHKRIVVNLSPNRLLEVPEVCDQPWPKDKEIIYEKGKDQKPNMLYFLAYQPSCSENLFAAGFAHEDPYTCLKKRAEGGGVAQVALNGRSFCCDDFCNCFSRGRSLSVDGFQLEDIPGTDPIQQRFVKVGVTGFCCSSIEPNSEPFFKEECGNFSNPCKFGFFVDLRSGQNLIFQGCPEIEQDGRVYSPMEGTLTYTYQGGGNTNCGCNQGRKGKVTLSGIKKCIWCRYVTPDPIGIGYAEPIETKTCEDIEMDPVTLCACIFNAKVSIGDENVYLTTMAYPTFRYPDGQALEITDDGTIVSKGCGDEIIFSCNDVN